MVTNTQEEITIGGVSIRFLVEGKSSGRSVAMFEFGVAPGGKVPIAHSHDAYEETLYGLKGTLTLTVDGVKTDLRSGDVLCIPRGAIHRFDNLSSASTRTLAILTPGLLGPDFFREVAAIMTASAGGSPKPATIAEVMRRHGLTPAP